LGGKGKRPGNRQVPIWEKKRKAKQSKWTEKERGRKSFAVCSWSGPKKRGKRKKENESLVFRPAAKTLSPWEKGGERETDKMALASQGGRGGRPWTKHFSMVVRGRKKKKKTARAIEQEGTKEGKRGFWGWFLF